MAHKGLTNWNSAHFGYADKYDKNPIRCKVCNRVCAFVEEDGICSSPKCRKD